MSTLDLEHHEDCEDHDECEAKEPKCSARKHEYTSDGHGGCTENPGVWSLGGTTYFFVDHCIHCGVVRQQTHYGVQRNPYQCDRVEYFEVEAES